MYHKMAPYSILHLSTTAVLLAGRAVADISCRPAGPVVPRPSGLANSKVVQSTLDTLTKTYQQVVDGEINGGWDLTNSSFSIGVVSLDQPDPATPLWEFHHLSPANVRGTKDIDKDSQYLIGSISKTFTDLILLKSGVNPDTPVQELLPALEGGRISWGDITLRDLGNHMAGIPPNCECSFGNCGATLMRLIPWLTTFYRWILRVLLPEGRF